MDTRALSSAALVGATLGVMLGGSFIAGGAARASASHARAGRLAAAAAHGFSDAALNAETAAMDPGAVALARRFDPMSSDIAAGGASLRLARFDESSVPALKPAAPLAAEPRPAMASVHLASAGGALQGARELDCMTDAVYYEARGESSEGQQAVAQVVMNRLRRPGYPKSVCGVVYQGAQAHECQFSFACDGAIYRAREPQAWRRAQGIAARALSGFVMAEVRDATHFHVARLGAIWGDGLVRVAQIGTHVFYRITRHDAFAVHAGRPDDDGDDGDATIPADGNQPTLILASAVSTGPVSAPTVVASAAPATPPPAPAAAADKPAAPVAGAAATPGPKAQS